jgi:hypothetical protein
MLPSHDDVKVECLVHWCVQKQHVVLLTRNVKKTLLWLDARTRRWWHATDAGCCLDASREQDTLCSMDDDGGRI